MNYQTFLEWMKGDTAAAQFVVNLHGIFEIWDDLIDKDKPVSDANINAAFMGALVILPRNPFYQAHFTLLNPLVESAILDWHTANALEAKKDEASLREAYVIRCSFYVVPVMCARIIGGQEWAQSVNLSLRSQPSEWPAYAAKHGVG